VPPADLADAIRRYFADPELRERLRAHAAESVRRLAPEEIYPRYERLLEEAAR
jgi:glycosyltransferase involved in cell wall biosynthesis